MKITKITIENFRSIKDSISFDIEEIGGKSCYALLGINETGKSNILDAISLLSEDEDGIQYAIDCNNEAEEADKDILVTYELKISNPDFYKTKFIESGLDKQLVDKIKFETIERKVSISKTDGRSDYFHFYLKNDKGFSKYIIGTDKIEQKTDANVVKDAEGKETNVLDERKLEGYLEDKFFDLFEKSMPRVIFWKSEDKYLINKAVDLNLFKIDQNNSIPLRNCFRIAGIDGEKVAATIDAAAGSIAKLSKLEHKLNEGVTQHINKIWKEHNVSIRFKVDNMHLSFLVEDKDNDLPKYEISQRSDGFKHFVSILLNLSAENKTQRLKNCVVLLDEPEVHLHPTGQKYLRDELLNIGKNNVVFFATHSIYMVDKKNFDRHLSVKKKGGVTKVSQVERNNPYKEEVLYEALGTSVLEHIEPNVLIVEGKTDRDIFELYARKFGKELSPPKVSVISADGVANIIKYTKFFNTKLIKGYVLVDSDDEGDRERKKILGETGYNSKNTFEVNNILNTKKKATLEDLFNKKYLISVVKTQYDLTIKFESGSPLIEQLKKFLHENKKPYRDNDKEELRKLFFAEITKLTKEELKKEAYFKFCKNLCDKIQ